MNLADIRAALASQLDTIGIRVHDKVPTTLNPPAAVIAVAEGNADEDFDGAFQISWVVMVLFARTDDARAQERIDAYLSTDTDESLFDAIRGNETLDGNVDYCRVVGWQPPASFEFAGASYVGVEVNVETLAH